MRGALRSGRDGQATKVQPYLLATDVPLLEDVAPDVLAPRGSGMDVVDVAIASVVEE